MIFRNFKQNISEIISKQDTADKLWQLLRLLQGLPDLIENYLDEKLKDNNENVKISVEKELKNKFSDLSFLLGKVLETELKPKLNKELESVKNQIITDLEKIRQIKIKVIAGKDGDTPIKGKDYFDGKKGDDGYTPVKGKDYFDGERGIDGKDGLRGESGKDGSPDKPEDIAKKLNILKDILGISLIKGLEERLNKIAWETRSKHVSKGGGMGDWVHQSFNVNSSTTTITLSDNIAANGFAILAFYNGQFIVRGTHYTQSGNILTLTFTPDDSKIIDVAFVKG